MQLVAAGGPTRRQPSGLEYYPLRRLPEELLEELRSPDGELIAAITRNRYGAAVLNTDAVLISDIDLVEPSSLDHVKAPRGPFLSRLLGRAPEPLSAQEADPNAFGLPGLHRRGEHHEQTLHLIEGFRARHPELGVRTYRTRTAADETHRAWVERYRAASQEVAVCRLLDTSGPAPSAVEEQIIALHDRATRPESGLRLA